MHKLERYYMYYRTEDGSKKQKSEVLTVVAEQEMHAVGVGQDDDGVGLDCSLGLQQRKAHIRLD